MQAPAFRAAVWMTKRTQAKTPVYLYLWAHQDELFKLAEPKYLIGHSS